MIPVGLPKMSQTVAPSQSVGKGKLPGSTFGVWEDMFSVSQK